ncbi:MAG: hypothetical protein AAF639_47630 [Chloroflexota bacterium]
MDYILYQNRTLYGTLGKDAYIFPTARQIIRLDPMTGEQEALVSHEDYDYHLCGGGSPYGCNQWYGDWVLVSRIPFEPQYIPYGPYSFDSPYYDIQKVDCLLYGRECEQPSERIALNWRTGELRPWAQLPYPTATPSFTRKKGN